MRAVPIVVVVALALAAAGCGGGGGGGREQPARSALADRLATLCRETRAAVEALGEPKDRGAAVFRPWADIGQRFVADVERLRGTTARQRRQVLSLAAYYDGFYDSLRLGYAQWASGESAAIKPTLERAYALLRNAEALAGRLGAAECSVRPFDNAT